MCWNECTVIWVLLFTRSTWREHAVGLRGSLELGARRLDQTQQPFTDSDDKGRTSQCGELKPDFNRLNVSVNLLRPKVQFFIRNSPQKWRLKAIFFSAKTTSMVTRLYRRDCLCFVWEGILVNFYASVTQFDVFNSSWETQIEKSTSVVDIGGPARLFCLHGVEF